MQDGFIMGKTVPTSTTRSSRKKSVSQRKGKSVRVPKKKSRKRKPNKPLWQMIVELGNSVPESEWEKLPTDLARNFHHYHHGSPKQDP
jgi:hypothetical protein